MNKITKIEIFTEIQNLNKQIDELNKKIEMKKITKDYLKKKLNDK